MARRPSIPGDRRHGLPRGDGTNAVPGTRALHEHVVRAKRRRRVEDAVRRAADAFDRTGDADEALRLVVVRRHVGVADRPVEAETVGGARLEIVVGHAERDAAVVVRASAEDPRAEPREVAARRHRVGLAFELGAAERRTVAESRGAARVGLALRPRPAMRHVVGPHVLFQVRHAQHRTSFEQQDRHAQIGKDVRDRTAPGAGSDDDDIMNGGARWDLRHVRLL